MYSSINGENNTKVNVFFVGILGFLLFQEDDFVSYDIYYHTWHLMVLLVIFIGDFIEVLNGHRLKKKQGEVSSREGIIITA